MLDVAGARRAAARGHDHVVWRDRDNQVMGVAHVEWRQASLRVDLWVHRFGMENSSTANFDVVMKGSRGYNARAYAICSECQRSVAVLVYKIGWSCGRCAELPNRSSLLAEEVRWAERLEEVAKLLKRTRPGSIRKKAYQAIVEEHAALLRKVGDLSVVANSNYHAKVSAEWVTALPVKKWQE